MPNHSTSFSSSSEVPGHAPITANLPPSDLQPAQDAIDYLKAYARERPEVAALWCLGIGFILGWKLKPW